jgi:hypothetical protein
MARLLKPGGELIHAIDVPFPSNGGLKRILKSLALDQFSGLLPHDIIQAYAKATPLAYASTVWFALGLPRSSLRHRNLGTARMVVDPQIVVESYEHGLNRVLKDDPNYVYKRQGSLLIHLKRYDRRSAA